MQKPLDRGRVGDKAALSVASRRKACFPRMAGGDLGANWILVRRSKQGQRAVPTAGRVRRRTHSLIRPALRPAVGGHRRGCRRRRLSLKSSPVACLPGHASSACRRCNQPGVFR
jgi:hypothetical protein